MKIAMVIERFPPDIGGSGTRFHKIAERLSKTHDVDVFTVGPQNTQDIPYAFTVHRFNLNSHPTSRQTAISRVIGHSVSALFQLLFRSYDIIDVDIWPIIPYFSARIAAPRTPTIVSWNVVWPFSFHKTISRMSSTLAYGVSKLSTHNITVSKLAKNILLEHLKMSPNRIEVIPNGVDDAYFKAKLAPQWGRIIFVGRLEPQKRIDLLLKAFKIFRKQVPDAELHIIGQGPLQPQLQRLATRTSGIYLHESIPGDRKDQLISELSRSWVFASASEFETYGLSTAESLSIGLPTVLTKSPYNGAVGELVTQGYNGLIVEHNNHQAIAEAFQQLYTDKTLWETLSHNAKYNTPLYSWDEVAKRVESAYDRLGKSRA